MNSYEMYLHVKTHMYNIWKNNKKVKRASKSLQQF